jgi:antitoxin component YwqK of YwqJK toxin-antitoxin module
MNKFKNRIISLVFLSASFYVFPQGEVNPNGYNVFKENGKITSEGTLRDGKPDGYWKTYYPSGKIKSEGNRKNFLLDSTLKFYNDKGILATEFNYKNNKKNGFKKSYDDEDGKLLTAENYIEDIKSGPAFFYYKSGKIKKKINFVNGREEGTSYEFDEDSTIISIYDYQMGFLKKQEKINRRDEQKRKQGMWKEFYVNGVVKSEGKYLDGKKDGFFKEYSPDGSLLNAEKFINGNIQTNVPELAKIDTKTSYYPGGKIKYSGGYKNEKPEGIHREYDTLGNIIKSKIFTEGYLKSEGILDEQGKQQGIWKEYHSNGKLKSKGEYKEGKRIGYWEFYHPEGTVEQKGKYDKKGRPQGEWKWYYENGQLLRDENYVDGKEDGIMTEYSDSGKVITKGEYIDGNREGAWFYELNNYREEGTYKNDKRDGEWKHFYIPGGNLRFIGKFVDGNPDGRHKFYYPNGNINQEGEYRAGNKEGAWKFYTEDGFLFLIIWYENDVEIKYDGVKIVSATEVK